MLKWGRMPASVSYFQKLTFFLFIAAALTYCKKNKIAPPRLSTEKEITYFGIETYKNIDLGSDAVGIISNDTIRFTLSGGYPLLYLFPTIHFSGKHMAPAENLAQNFSNPVTYTVTAEDGTTRNFIILGKSILNRGSKEILSFSFKAGNNPSISSDVKGTISSDSILVTLPFGTDLNHLIPFILINGASVSPDNLMPQNFSVPLTYKVTAEDGSSRIYTVVVSS